MLARKLLMCWWGACGMIQKANDTHIWGECPRCGKVAGLVSREFIRRYIEAEQRSDEYERERAQLAAEIVKQAKK